ncbi:PucR family transcriptional regulator [Cohnella herbarum]|uniref:PucR family transcriptional regulator n=1 Tax=Cohnella herbarum TaxID=2728023 RepID=A0A7Z2VN10_9BACL|nr:PucR family transcriptional regulator [Cohnella herbarum]QJD85919.1 PucR family transcriptional regulator [Cohnella herbarum]
MTLDDLLQIPVFHEAKMVAGHKGSSNTVTSVNMMDAPDIIDFLKPEELLLTTAFAVKDQPEALETLVSLMAGNGCAGLGIKTKRFLSEIPINVLKLADRLSFPIIELPLDQALGEMLGQSLSFVLEKKTEELRFALEMHQSFSRMAMNGKGLTEIIDSLATLLECPVLLLDRKPEPLSYSVHFGHPPYQMIIPTILRFYLEHPDLDPVVRQFCLLDPTPMRPIEIIAYPINTDRHQGSLLVLNPLLKSIPLPRLVVEQVANIIGFEMMKRQAVKERSRRYKNEFFSDLIEGRVASDQEIINRGKNYGLLNSSPYICVVAKEDQTTDHFPYRIEHRSAEDIYAKRDYLYAQLKYEFTKLGLPFVMFTKNDLIVLLFSSQRTESSEEALLKRISTAQEQLYQRLSIPVSFGVGTPVEQLIDIPLTYSQAFDALQSGFLANMRMFVQSYRAKETVDLLRLINNEDLIEFWRDSFKELLKKEDKEKEDLMKTLRVYLDNQCQIAETAKQLYIHRNTVIYRLDKCEQLTNRHLRDPSDSLRLRIAFVIDSLLQ